MVDTPPLTKSLNGSTSIYAHASELAALRRRCQLLMRRRGALCTRAEWLPEWMNE